MLFESLPIPEELGQLLDDIYSGNLLEFGLSDKTVVVAPTAGVRQGDPLSSTVFNLAAEPSSKGVIDWISSLWASS